MRRAGAPTRKAIQDLSAHYARGRWAFSTPICDVYTGRDLRLDRDVHARFFTPRVLRDAAVADALLDAAVPAAALAHPALVTVYDIGEIGGRLCVVTDAPARRIADSAGPLDPDEADALARDWAAGLRAAHDAGFVHGDVTAEALFVGADGTGKVADIGLFAAAAERDDYFRPRLDHGARPLSPAADIAALAATLRQRGAPAAADRVLQDARDPSPIALAPAEPLPPAGSIPTRPLPPPDEVAAAPRRPRRSRRSPWKATRRATGRFRTSAAPPYLAVTAAVVGLLVVAFHDPQPPIPGHHSTSAPHHTHLPPQIPQ